MNSSAVSKGDHPILSYEVDLSKHLPEWVTVGFSAATGNLSEVHTIYSWEFESSLLEAASSSPSKKGYKKNIHMLQVSLGVGSSALFGVLLCLFWFLLSSSNTSTDEPNENVSTDVIPMEDDFEGVMGPKRILYQQLVCATNNFSEERKLGEGGFGAAYRGFLCDLNLDVAVKRVSKTSKQGLKEFMSEVKIISRLRHKNLVQLVGWCHQQGELLLVYEVMLNGSLDSHLFGQKSLLTWEVRYNIALGLASALLYLHESLDQSVVHRDIKSSNVMLNSNFSARLGDFGLARLVDRGQKLQTTAVAGTMGYMAPEYIATGMASTKLDVYSFGIVVLEIACGRRSIEHSVEENKIRLVDWVWELFGVGKFFEAVDSRLINSSTYNLMRKRWSA